jgi:predicted DNA-binding protein (UPF0278 family)
VPCLPLSKLHILSTGENKREGIDILLHFTAQLEVVNTISVYIPLRLVRTNLTDLVQEGENLDTDLKYSDIYYIHM